MNRVNYAVCAFIYTTAKLEGKVRPGRVLRLLRKINGSPSVNNRFISGQVPAASRNFLYK